MKFDYIGLDDWAYELSTREGGGGWWLQRNSLRNDGSPLREMYHNVYLLFSICWDDAAEGDLIKLLFHLSIDVFVY